jgi:hypothetical protein
MNERQLDDDWHSRLLREQFEQSRAKESAPTNGVEPKQHYVSIEAAVPSEPLQQTTLEEIEELTGDDYGQSFASHERRKTNAASSHSDGDRVEGDSATNLLGEEDDTQPSTPNQKSFPKARVKSYFSRRTVPTKEGKDTQYPDWMKAGWLGKLTYEQIKNLPEGTLPPVAPPLD